MPKFLTRNPTVATHSICVPDPDRHDRELYLPLALSGVTSYLSISKPTVEEFESGNFARIELTSLDLTWDPGDTTYATQEDDITDSHGEIINDPAARGPKTLVINSLNSMAVDAADITDDVNFGNVLESNVTMSLSSLNRNYTGTVRTKPAPPINYETLSKRWNIAPDRAKATVARTTQRGVRTCVHPSLSK